jgi:hypothetical protein
LRWAVFPVFGHGCSDVTAGFGARNKHAHAAPRLVSPEDSGIGAPDGSSLYPGFARHAVRKESALRIAQVAPLYESVPPKLYGGTERVVSYLTEELVRQGHEVTLFASGDSTTRARLVAACDRSLRLDQRCVDQMAHHFLLLERVFQLAHEFDVIHFHVDYLHFPLSRRQPYAQLTTLHGRLDLPDLVPLYEEFGDMPLVSISQAQREPLPWANWLTTVYHGLPEDLYQPRTGPGTYLAFLGRVCPEKRSTARSRSPGAPASRSRSQPKSILRTRTTTKRRSCRCSTTRVPKSSLS